jgi:hypothetical protein
VVRIQLSGLDPLGVGPEAFLQPMVDRARALASGGPSDEILVG